MSMMSYLVLEVQNIHRVVGGGYSGKQAEDRAHCRRYLECSDKLSCFVVQEKG
jgi:hypothetical protein